MSLNNNRRCTTPVIQDPNSELSGNCNRLVGGAKLPSVPSAVISVQNENNPDFWTEENLIPVLDEDGSLIVFDNV